MNNKQEAIMSGLAIALLLFTAMLDPLISTSLAIILLTIFTIYKFTKIKNH